MAIHPNSIAQNRRSFMRFLAASPLAAAAQRPDPMVWAPFDPNHVIASPEEAVSVFDLEPACRANVPPAHFGYMASGVDDEATLRANRADFQKFKLRPRRLNDVSKMDLSIQLFGRTWGSPIYIAPIGGSAAYHPDGELAIARAAKAGNHLQMLSTMASASIKDATEARGAPIVFQLYPTASFEVAKLLVKRAEAAGSPAVAVTVDQSSGRKLETQLRLARTDERDCTQCHDRTSPQASVARKGNWAGIELEKFGIRGIGATGLTLEFFKRLRDVTDLKILAKGISTPEDAALCVSHGLDGLVVSNHGGRAEDSGLSTIDALPGIVAAVQGRIPVLIDSGFRRGADVVKALALGATAVGIGRPIIWGLGAFGEEGVARALQIIHAEARSIMGQCGARTVKELTPAHVQRVT
jgi:4-hydroxymandelate oxidase